MRSEGAARHVTSPPLRSRLARLLKYPLALSFLAKSVLGSACRAAWMRTNRIGLE
jgi:hypothetical protein